MNNLSSTITHVRSCTILRDALLGLVEGLAAQVQELGTPEALALAAAIDAAKIDLVGAVTIGTSHLAVDPSDSLIPAVRAAFEKPVEHRAAHAAAIAFAIDSKNLDIAAELATVTAERDALVLAHDGKVSQLAAALSDAERKDAALKAAAADLAQKQALLDAANLAVEAKNATIVAKDAQLEAMAAQRDAAETARSAGPSERPAKG